MTKNIQTISIMLLLLISITTYGQTNAAPNYLPNITPPSPVAYELGKYGNVPTGLFTGSTNLNIPLYTYKTKSIEVPITMFYNNSGIRVDATSGNVGLGWNFNCGGVINRVVRDKNDETTSKVRPNDNILSSTESPEKFLFYKSLGEDPVDSEPDLYSFNFNGNSGQFIFDRNNNILMLKDSKIKIEKITGGFIATSLDGIQYLFLDTEFSIMRSSASHQPPQGSITSWLLSKIIHPNGDLINFTYQDYNYSYVASQAQSLLFPLEYNSACAGSGLNYQGIVSLEPIYDNMSTIKAKRLIKVSSNISTYGTIDFLYTTIDTDIETFNKISDIIIKNENQDIIEKLNFSYQSTTNKRTFLNSITYLDPTKKYSFEYIDPEGFPQRLSLAQDSWGYYNGKLENSSIIPKGLKGYGLDDLDYGGADKDPDENYTQKGMLSKIVYPTKGYTILEYEPNDFYGEKTSYPSKINSNLKAISTLTNPIVTSEKIITSPLDQFIKISGTAIFNPNCNSASDTGFHHVGTLTVIELENNTEVGFGIKNGIYFVNTSESYKILDSTSSDIWFEAKANTTYKIILKTNYRCTFASCDITYYPTAPTTIQTNVASGGLRVKRISDYTNSNVSTIKRLFYSNSINNLNISSGKVVTANPNHFDIQRTRQMCPTNNTASSGPAPIEYYDTAQRIATSSSLISLYDEDGSNIHYPKVIESIGGDNFENGLIEHNFKINTNSGASSLMGDPLWSCPKHNNGWNNGNETSTIYYKKGLVKTSEKTFNYILDPRNASRYETVFAGRKSFNLGNSYELYHICSANDVSLQSLLNWYCITSHNHTYVNDGWCTSSGSYNVHRNIPQPNPCSGLNAGYTIYNSNSLENLSIAMYNIYSNWSYLSSTVEKTYDTNGLNPITTTKNYFYDNTNHLQLTREEVTNSKGEILETKYQYAHEKGNQAMIDANMIGIPLVTQTFKGAQKLSEQETVYAKDATTNNLLLPKTVLASKGTQTPETKITYNSYDDKGNITQYTPEGGISTAVIWGYNKSLPIAKIENATYAQVQQYVATLQSDSNNDTLTQNSFSTLRNALPNAMITTYTHKPLVGISTIVDPKGNQTTYTYDSFNRLKEVKDHQGNVVKENSYNYRP